MKVEKRDGIFYLAGEFDIFHASDVQSTIMDNYDGKDDMILDFGSVTFMDSTGLGILISILKEIEDDGKKIKIQNVSKRIKKVFVITELDKVFGIDE